MSDELEHLWIGLAVQEHKPTDNQLEHGLVGVDYTALSSSDFVAECWVGPALPKDDNSNEMVRFRGMIPLVSKELRKQAAGEPKQTIPPHAWLDAYGGDNEDEPDPGDYCLMFDLVSGSALFDPSFESKAWCNGVAQALEDMSQLLSGRLAKTILKDVSER